MADAQNTDGVIASYQDPEGEEILAYSLTHNPNTGYMLEMQARDAEAAQQVANLVGEFFASETIQNKNGSATIRVPLSRLSIVEPEDFLLFQIQGVLGPLVGSEILSQQSREQVYKAFNEGIAGRGFPVAPSRVAAQSPSTVTGRGVPE